MARRVSPVIERAQEFHDKAFAIDSKLKAWPDLSQEQRDQFIRLATMDLSITTSMRTVEIEREVISTKLGISSQLVFALISDYVQKQAALHPRLKSLKSLKTEVYVDCDWDEGRFNGIDVTAIFEAAP